MARGELAAAAAVILAALLAAPARAASCLGKDAAGDDDPPTLEALQKCQAKDRKAYAERVKARTGRAPTAEALERLDDLHRSEAGVYLSRHVQTGDDRPAPSAKRGRAPDATGPDVDALRAAMLEKSEGGKKGVTPEMAADMRAFLQTKQGGVSPDMQELLDATAKDGPNLSNETMRKLRGAAKQAKAQGMDLGIAPETEKQLLEGEIPAGDGKPGL